MNALTCLIPGSFDPVTLGHLDIIERTAQWASRVVVVAMHNPAKQGLFAPQERVAFLRQSLAGLENVEILSTEPALLIDICAMVNATLIVKGVRDDQDVRFERPMADLNRRMSGVETVWLPAAPQWQSVSSSLVREIASLGGDISEWVPAPVAAALYERFG